MSDDRPWLDRVNQALNDGVDSLDAATRACLAQARVRAMSPAPRRPMAWLGAGGLVLASLMAAVLWLGSATTPLPNDFDASLDIELLSAGDTLELYRELEFYYWLDEVAADAG